MFEVYALLFACTVLASLVDRKTIRIDDKSTIRKETSASGMFHLFLVICILIWFAGSRTRMNDTTTYINAFNLRVPDSLSGIRDTNWSLGSNPLFYIYQLLIKVFISQDSQVFILLSSIIIETLMVLFLYRYSWNFGGCIYVFIAFAVYGFTLAAMKQTMATAIGIWAVAQIINKKNVRAFVLMAIAVLFHPYVIVLLIAIPLLNKGIWNRFIVIMLLCTLGIGFIFSRFTTFMFRLAELIGQDYEENWDSASSGVGISRVLAYAIVPVLSLLYREKLEKKGMPFFNLCINMSIIAFCFSVISWFGGAVLFGRMPAYFGCFICIAISYIMSVVSDTEMIDSKHKESYIVHANSPNTISYLSLAIYSAYLFYYYTYYKKFFDAYNVGFWGSMYDRVSIIQVLLGGK